MYELATLANSHVVKFSRNGVPPPMSSFPPPEIAVPPPKVVVPPPGNDVPSVTIWGKMIEIVATRGQISRLKCTKYYFGWGSAPDPAGEITALAQNE